MHKNTNIINAMKGKKGKKKNPKNNMGRANLDWVKGQREL